MSLSIQRSLIEQFNLNDKGLRFVYLKRVGSCLVASNLCEAIGYSDDRSDRKATQRHVPEKYKMRYRDVKPNGPAT